MGTNENEAILVVEDSDDDFEATLRAFKKRANVKNPIQRCASGREALDYLLRQGEYSAALRPAIVLLDLNMPGINGLQVLEKIKSEPTLRDIPVIVLTTSNDERDIEQCYRLGANTYIRKPVELESFMKAVQSLSEYWLEIALLPKAREA